MRIAPNTITERIANRIDETVAEIATPFGYMQDSPIKLLYIAAITKAE